MKLKRKLSSLKKKLAKRLLKFSLRWAARHQVDVLKTTYASLGIGRFENLKVSGEQYLIDHVLTQLLSRPDAIAFDIGAHQGSYTSLLAEKFSDLKVYSFEPNPNTFEILTDQISKYENVSATLAAVGDQNATTCLFVDSANATSSHSTLLRDGQISILNKTSLDEVEVDLLTVDSFCEANQIDSIDFLKVDTEGNELNVLAGAARLLKQDRISMLQLEFTQLNIETRIFTRDIRRRLPNYDFFRLSENGLIPLGDWNPHQEIFDFQNLLAVLPHIATELRLPGQTANRSEISRIYQEVYAQTKSETAYKMIVGAGGQSYSGWISTDYPAFDICDETKWDYFLANGRLSHLLAEHVFEHLTEQQIDQALVNAFSFLNPGGRFRIAVPDGNHPNPEYIDAVRPGGTGPGADDHKHLFTVDSLTQFGERARFRTEPKEYWTSGGTFEQNEMHDTAGPIVRSFKNDPRNADQKPNYTSLIIDFVKPS